MRKFFDFDPLKNLKGTAPNLDTWHTQPTRMGLANDEKKRKENQGHRDITQKKKKMAKLKCRICLFKYDPLEKWKGTHTDILCFKVLTYGVP